MRPTVMTSQHSSNCIHSRVKTLIVALAVWGWFPMKWADSINRMGEKFDE